ncbi:MAG: hypothetical protein R3D70_07725 [Rhizobiaceae bacterium]
MKPRADITTKSAWSRAAELCGLGMAFMLAACTSNINEGVGPPTTVPSLSGSAPQNTGTYPNLNIRPQVAANQITAEQRASAGARLNAATQSAQRGASTPAMSAQEQARLKKLADDKGASVLAEIEGQQ